MKATNNSLEVFDSMPVSKAVFKNTIPAMASMLMVLVYNLADTFFIGQTHNALMVAAVSLATPVFLLFMAVGTIFGIGGTSVISRAMGQGRKGFAKQVSAFCMWSCVIVGTSMSVLLWIFMDKILVLVGASSETWTMAKTYLEIVILSGPFVLIGNCYSNILRAEGQSIKAMMGMLVGNLLNVVLDPLMILGFGWNIAGAATATVIGNIVGAAYYIIYFIRGTSMLSISPKDFTLKGGVCKNVLSIGIPASLGSILMSVSSIVLNSCMAHYGDMAVAGIGVAVKITMMTGMVCIGIGQGVQPLLGYCVGAENWRRYRRIMRFSLIFALVLSIIMTVICYIFTDDIIRAFVTNENAVDYGISFARILLSTSALFGVFYVLINALQAMGAATQSLIINLSRQGLIYIPALCIFGAVFGAAGLVWAQPVADTLSILLAALLYHYKMSGTQKETRPKKHMMRNSNSAYDFH